MIEYETYQAKELPNELAQIFDDFFGLPAAISDDVEQFISSLEKDCMFAIEYPYVDKVLRAVSTPIFRQNLATIHGIASGFLCLVALSDFRDATKYQKLRPIIPFLVH